MRIFIQFFSFIFFILICPLIYVASGLDKPPVLSADESQRQPGEQFKKAVSLIDIGSYKEAESILLSFAENDFWHESALFLLGRLYEEQDFPDKAEDYFKRAAVQRFLLKDYALKSLVGIYIVEEKFDKALQATKQIQNKALVQEARQAGIKALLALKKEEEALKALYQYIKKYPDEMDYKLVLAGLLKNMDKRKEATRLFKEIYIEASPLAIEALRELKAMNADIFSRKEVLKRAENLSKRGNFPGAEVVYRQVIKSIDDSAMKDKIRFAIGMCQFRQKKYNIAAKSFGLLENPKSMYWKARALYRISDINGFKKVLRDFVKKHPGSEYLANLFLMLASEQRRAGKLTEATITFRKVLNDFPEDAENALWGLGWMNYTNGNYKEATEYFLELTSSAENDNRYKYLYWRAKNYQMLSENCMRQKAGLNPENNACSKEKDNEAFSKLLEDTGYYGFVSKKLSRDFELPVNLEFSVPKRPEGKVYERIEMLKFLGMNKEVADEIKMLIKFTRNLEEFKYLGYAAIDAGEYKSIIYFAEENKNAEFLPLAYPLGYWDTVKDVAKNEAVDPYLVLALIREESRFDPDAISSAGAVGLMQLMPATAYRIKKKLRIELKNDSELYDAKKNILIGTHYLSLLIKEFKELPMAIAAYNAGENAVREWLFDSNYKDIEEFIEDIPYRETKRYVKNVLKSYWQYRTIEGLPILVISYQESETGKLTTDN